MPVPKPAAAAISMMDTASWSVAAVVPMRPALVTMPVAIEVAVFAESGTYSGRRGILFSNGLELHAAADRQRVEREPAVIAREVVARDRDLMLVHAVADDENHLGRRARDRLDGGSLAPSCSSRRATTATRRSRQSCSSQPRDLPSIPGGQERVAFGVLEHLRGEVVGILDAYVDDLVAVVHRHEARADEARVGGNVERRVARVHLGAQLGIDLHSVALDEIADRRIVTRRLDALQLAQQLAEQRAQLARSR